jgi:hypothetical protein
VLAVLSTTNLGLSESGTARGFSARADAGRTAGHEDSGDDIGDQVVLDLAIWSFSLQLALLQAGDLQLVGRPRAVSASIAASRSRCSILQHFQALAHFFFGHAASILTSPPDGMPLVE